MLLASDFRNAVGNDNACQMCVYECFRADSSDLVRDVDFGEGRIGERSEFDIRYAIG